MNETAQLFVFGTLVLIPWTLNAIAARADFGEYADATYMAAVVCLVWIITNAVGLFIGPPQSKALHPIIDLIAMGVVVRSAIDRGAWWKNALASLYAIQIALHAAFWIAWAQSDELGRDVLFRYLAGLNILWLCQLIVAGWPGGRHVADTLLARLRRRRGLASD